MTRKRRICRRCGGEIFNRRKSAEYCRACVRPRRQELMRSYFEQRRLQKVSEQ